MRFYILDFAAEVRKGQQERVSVMPAERITSRQNGRIKEIIRLTSSADARKETGAFVLEGARLCGDAAASGIEILLLCVSDSAAGRKEAGTLTAVA